MDEGVKSIECEGLTSSTDVDALSALLGTTYKKIKYFYYKRAVSSHYRVFNLPKKGGASGVFRHREVI